MYKTLKRVYDPLYGVIEFTDKEYALLMSPDIQRLRYVRMCNINSMLVTGASEISRFEHIIGVLHLAKTWIENHKGIAPKLAEEFCSAALLHDFQTGPFGHSLQYVFEDNTIEDNFIHDDIDHGRVERFHQDSDAAAGFLGRPFNSNQILGNSWASVANLIKGNGELGPLISGTMDLDNIDNVVRLAYHVGVAKAEDAEVAISIAKDITVAEGIICISHSSIKFIERWQSIRKRLYELLLLDWAEFSAKAMLTYAMELAVEFGHLGADSWLLTDSELYQKLEGVVGEAQEVSQITKRIKCGDLYHPLCIFTSKSTDVYELFSNIETKKELRQSLTIKMRLALKINVSLIIHPILDNKKTSRSVDVVIRESNTKTKIGIDSNQLLLGVFLSKPLISTEKERQAYQLCEEFLINLGFDEPTSIEDPMSDGTKIQLALL